MPEVEFHGLVSQSDCMHRVFHAVRAFAPAREPVLIGGESGTGKERLSWAIHAESGRRGRFVALNCGALSDGVVDGELFGHVRGAFTGAHANKVGAFEAAHGGTLMLDEVGELPPDVQVRLLRVLETGSVRRVGDVQERPVDVRIVSATHRSLESMVNLGTFREDLYHRLCVLDVDVPPLRRRTGDVALLAPRLLPRGARLTAAALERLCQHPWPGNVRELKNVLARAAWVAGTLAVDGDEVERDDSDWIRAGGDGASGNPVAWIRPEHLRLRATVGRAPSRTSLARATAEAREALLACGGNRAAAARRLGLPRSTFHDRLRRLGIP